MIFLLLLFPFISLQASELSEMEVRKSILKNFPLIEEARMKLESSQSEVTASRGAFDTKLKFKHRNHIEDRYDNEYSQISLEKLTPFQGVSLIGGHRQGTGIFAPYEGKYDTSSAGEIFAGISLPLLRERSVDGARLETGLATLDEKISRNELLIKKNLYLHKGLSTYQKWVFAYQRLKVIEGLLKLAEERQEMLNKRLRAGDVERLKLVDNRRSILKRKDELLSAQVEFRRISAELALYVRANDGSMLNLESYSPPKLDLIPRKDFPVTFDPEKLPQTQLLKLEQEKNQRVREFHENQRLPQLNVELLASRELAASYPYDPQRVHIGVVFEFPLENRKATGKSVSEAYKGMALEKRRSWIENELSVRYRQTRGIYEAMLERTSLTLEAFENSKKMAEAERTIWRRGGSDLFIVTLREQDAADAEISVWKTRYELAQTILDADLYSASLYRE